MVLLHAPGDRAGGWAPVADSFAESFHVFAVDLRGHGGSSRPEAYSFAAMREDVIGVLEQLDVGPVTLIGHSMGGVIAYRVAIDRPELVSRLVIEDVSPPYPRRRAIPDRPDDADSLDFDWERLDTIAGPTLIIGGGPDSHIPQDKLLETADRIPVCDLVTIPAGHHVHAAEPALFSRVVLDWLQTQH